MRCWRRPRGLSAALGGLVLAAAFAVGTAAVGEVRPVPALVEVRVADGLAEDRAVGVVVAPGRVLTVAHVLGDDAGARWSRSRDGTGGDARVIAVDRASDLALLAAPGAEGPPVSLASGDRAARGVAVALPSGTRAVAAAPLRATFTDVLGTTVRRPVLRLDTAVAPGDSGSPVLDDRGRLAGLVFAADRTHADTSWATAAPALRCLLAAPR